MVGGEIQRHFQSWSSSCTQDRHKEMQGITGQKMMPNTRAGQWAGGTQRKEGGLTYSVSFKCGLEDEWKSGRWIKGWSFLKKNKTKGLEVFNNQGGSLAKRVAHKTAETSPGSWALAQGPQAPALLQGPHISEPWGLCSCLAISELQCNLFITYLPFFKVLLSSETNFWRQL